MTGPELIYQSRIMDHILSDYRSELGDDFIRYSNHCYRLLNILKLMSLDDLEEYKCKILLPFHDIGIWAHNTMDYIPGSIRLACEYAKDNQLDIDHREIASFIGNHHKITRSKNSLDEKLRKADLIDLSYGIFSFGLPSQRLREIRNAFPFHGFQRLVFRKALAYGCKHMTNPFPMMKI